MLLLYKVPATEVCWCQLIDVWIEKVILQQIKFICIYLHTHNSWSVEEWWQQLCVALRSVGTQENPSSPARSLWGVKVVPMFLHHLLDSRKVEKLAGIVSKKSNGRRGGISTVEKYQGTSKLGWRCYLICYLPESQQTIEQIVQVILFLPCIR